MQWNWSQQRTTVGHLKLFAPPSSRQTSIPDNIRKERWTDVSNRIEPSHNVASLILRERVSLSLSFSLSYSLSFHISLLILFSHLLFHWNKLILSHRIWLKLWLWLWLWIRMRQLSNNQRDRLPGWELELIIVWLWFPVSVLRKREGVQHLHDGLHSSRRDPMVCHQGNF